jgi:magnesium dechelatase
LYDDDAIVLSPVAALIPMPQVARSIFDPPPFNPTQLTVDFIAGATRSHPVPPLPRRYTLTHNDITGALYLSIGSEYNEAQISGFYTRLLRDEVVAEWVFDVRPTLHLYCHVSGEERWLAPPWLRNYIFRRELPLVSHAHTVKLPTL